MILFGRLLIDLNQHTSLQIVCNIIQHFFYIFKDKIFFFLIEDIFLINKDTR